MTNKNMTQPPSGKNSTSKTCPPNDSEHLFRNASSAHRHGRLAEAEKGYQDILKIRPDWGRALNALGTLFLDLNQPEKAGKIFEKAVHLTPPNLSACYNLGRMKQLENDHNSAIPIYRIMLDEQSDIGEAWNNLGVAYRETGKPDAAISCFRKAVVFAPDMAEAWNNLGVAQDESNLTDNALQSYKKAIEIQPDYPSAHLNLGISLQKAEQFKKAQGHYNKVLEIQPDNKVATFMLQSMGLAEIPDAAPVEHVRSIFDRCAENFETILIKDLEYKTPERLFHLIHPYLTENMNILDLGCGTGLGAHLYHPFAKSLTGVDVSSKMLEKAAEKKIYSRLEIFDILQEWNFPHKFDLIYSSDVFVYFGNLDLILRSASSSLVHGGIMAFSVELLDDNMLKYQLFPSGRYAHSHSYIQDCLERHGLQLLESTQATIRKQSGKPVKGLLIAAARNS